MKKRNLLRIVAWTALAMPLIALTSCQHDTSPSLFDNDNEISATLPDADLPFDSDVSSKEESEYTSNSSEDTPLPKTEQYIRCTGERVYLRSGAGTGYSVLGIAEKNTVYVVLEKTENWYKTYYRGKIAYISASYASAFTLEKSDEQTENVLEQGYKLIGTPYVYGAIRLHDGNGNFIKGFTTQKFDCSSFVQYVFYQGAQKLLNVNTRTQVKQGQFVPRNELQRGDCIFFTNEERQNKTGIERIGHVAVYLGDDYILHTASDYARIEKITAKRRSFYVEARRFL